MKKLIVICIMGLLAVGFSSEAQIVEPPRDGHWDKTHTPDQQVVPFQFVREADVMWAKRIWRTIDFREKKNQTFLFPLSPVNGRKNFMNMVVDALKEGTITPYEFDITNDEFLVPLTPDQLLEGLNKTENITQTRPYPPYEEYDTTVTTVFDPATVKQLRIKEDWFFDRSRSVMEVRIIGLCPVVEEMDETGEEVKGMKPLFWIYFPEARTIFAKTEVFNPHNDSERRSWDDVFMKRTFGSFIYKEQNVFDRKIGDYKKGLEALLESEKIKNDIFIYEHDLWHY